MMQPVKILEIQKSNGINVAGEVILDSKMTQRTKGGTSHGKWKDSG
jgi:hypothetical protein